MERFKQTEYVAATTQITMTMFLNQKMVVFVYHLKKTVRVMWIPVKADIVCHEVFIYEYNLAFKGHVDIWLYSVYNKNILIIFILTYTRTSNHLGKRLQFTRRIRIWNDKCISKYGTFIDISFKSDKLNHFHTLNRDWYMLGVVWIIIHIFNRRILPCQS